jgi:hypothetical protein
MDSTEDYINQLLAYVGMRRGKVTTPLGERVSRAHADYHAALHDPMLRSSPRWCQLAFLNYTVFYSLGLCARILCELRSIDAKVQSEPADIHQRLMRPATIDAFTARLGAALDALAGSAFGIVSRQEPLDRIDIHFNSLFDPTNEQTYKKLSKQHRTGPRAEHYIKILERNFKAARRDLREFVRYRNKIVHTVLLPRRQVGDQLFLARIDRIFRPDQRVDPSAFVRIYSTTNPVYLESDPPAEPQRALDFQRRPVTEQLTRYHALAVKHAAAIVDTIRRGYIDLVRPELVAASNGS